MRAGPLFAATVNVTVPMPLPLDEGPRVIHGASLVVLQTHPGAVETATGVPAPPDAGTDCEDGVMLNVQAFWQFIVVGAVVIVAVLIDQSRDLIVGRNRRGPPT